MTNQIAIQDINGLTLPDGSAVTTSIYYNRDSADAFISNLRNFALSIDRDISTKKGRDNIASIAYKIAQMKKPIEVTGKALVEEKKQEVERVEKEKKALEEKIEADRLAKIQAEKDAEDKRLKAIETAELEKKQVIENERKRVEAENKKIEEENAIREKDLANRKAINNRILKALLSGPVLLNEAQAKAIIKMIFEGKIPDLAIKY